MFPLIYRFCSRIGCLLPAVQSKPWTGGQSRRDGHFIGRERKAGKTVSAAASAAVGTLTLAAGDEGRSVGAGDEILPVGLRADRGGRRQPDALFFFASQQHYELTLQRARRTSASGMFEI